MINVEKKKLHFKGVGGTEMKEHEVTMEFFKEIDPEKSKFAVRPREVSDPESLGSSYFSLIEWTEIPFGLGVVCAGEGRGGPVLGSPTGEQAEAALAEDRLQELGGRG